MRKTDEQARREEENLPELIDKFHIEDFTRHWSEFDTNGDNLIRRDRLPYIVAQLEFPFGTGPPQQQGIPQDGEDATEAAAAIAAIAAGPGNDQLTWVPEVPEKDLEAAREVITKVKGIGGLHKHSLSTADQVHFQEALRGQIEYAFRYPLGVEVAMIDEVLIRKKAAKKAAAEEPDSESSEDSDEEEVRQSRKRWRRLSAWTA